MDQRYGGVFSDDQRQMEGRRQMVEEEVEAVVSFGCFDKMIVIKHQHQLLR